MRWFVFIILVSVTIRAVAQQGDFKILPYEVHDGDTIFFYDLPGITKIDARDTLAQRKFLKLVRDVRKTLPYAKMTAFRLQLLEQNLALMTDKHQKKEYVHQTEKAIKDQFTRELKNLTITQGKILVKLIHRETGHTSYELLKDYKGNAGTFFWQTMAMAFGNDLKKEYDPVEDYQIEMIIKSLGFN